MIFQIDQHVKRIKVGLVPETLIVQPEAGKGVSAAFGPVERKALPWLFFSRVDILAGYGTEIIISQKQTQNDRQGTVLLMHGNVNSF